MEHTATSEWGCSVDFLQRTATALTKLLDVTADVKDGGLLMVAASP